MLGDRIRTHTEGGKETGRNGLQPQGRTHWGDPDDPPEWWQERYSEATGPSPARLHRGPWQTSAGAMEATDDRLAGTRPSRGAPARQRGPATRAKGVRQSYRRLARAIPPVVRDTPHGWPTPRAAAHERGHVTLLTDTFRDTNPAATTRKPHTVRAQVDKSHVATYTAHETERGWAPVNRCQVCQNTAHAHTPRAAKPQHATVYIPRVGRTGATQPTRQISGRSGTRRPLVRARPGCIGDHGKRQPEPWKQLMTGLPAHSRA